MSSTPSFAIQPKSSYQQIDVKNIEGTNKWSLHPFLPSAPSSTLLSSIQQIGLLHPPILFQISPDRYELLCGRFRIKAYERTNPSAINIISLVLDETTTSESILQTVLEDQLLTSKGLSSMEKAYFFKYCLNFMEINEAAEKFLPIINEKIQIHTIKKLFRLLELEREIQISIHYSKISSKTALELQTLIPKDRLKLHGIFMDLELGGGKQNRLLALSKDLAYRDGITIDELLSGADFKKVIMHPEMNKPQKITNLLTTLQRRLSPQSTSAEEDFHKKVQKMDLPVTCSISHSQAFERDDISVTMHFTNLHKVEEKLSEIRGIMDN